MNFDDLKDKVLETFSNTWAEIQESSFYNTLHERYETSSSSTQSAIKAGGAAFVLLILLSIPMSFYSSSSDSITNFEADRAVLRDLLKAGKSDGAGAILSQQVKNEAELQSKATTIARGFRLAEEQRGAIEAFDVSKEGRSLAPKGSDIAEYGVSLGFKKLNLNEIIEFGTQLQSRVNGATILSLDISADAEKDHYFDVVYKLVAFALPYEPEAEEKSSGKGKSKKRSRRGRRGKSKGKDK